MDTFAYQYFLLLAAILAIICHHFTRAKLGQTKEQPERLAFVTYLPATSSDIFFINTRIIVYQLLHSKMASDLPVVVLVTADLPVEKRCRLREDGAIVSMVGKICLQGLRSSELTRLWVFELTEYDRVCYFDADTMILDSLDGVFNDPASHNDTLIIGDHSKTATASHHTTIAAQANDWVLPSASSPQTRFDMGFMVLKPCHGMLRHYLSFVECGYTPDRMTPDQDLLNYAHRQEDHTPWRQLQPVWHSHSPRGTNMDEGVKSFRNRPWEAEYNGLLPRLWEMQRTEMEAFWSQNCKA